MNTGIQDAYNLAWKLALVSRGLASSSLLDSYEEERRPVAAGVIEDTVRRSVNFGKPTEPPGRLHDTQILVSYTAGPLASGETGYRLGPGDRIPDVQGLRHQGMGFSLRLFDLIRRPRFTLLALPDSGELQQLEAVVGQLSTLWPGLFATIAILPAGRAWDDPPGITVVEDANKAVSATFGQSAPGAVLLRPDGYIAFVGSISAEPLLDYLRSILGGSPPPASMSNLASSRL
jgi:hypothetical protein